MNILLINHYAGGPRWGAEYRPYHLAHEWVKQGHEVLIAAASHSHERSAQPVLHGDIGEDTADGVRYRWYRTPAYHGHGLARLKNLRAFLAALRRDGVSLAVKFQPDVVIASSTYPLDVKVAGMIARASGALLVYEVHELWPLSLVHLGGLWRVHPFVLLCRAAERAAYRRADVVVSLLPKVHEHMRARGLDVGKLHIVPNGVSAEEWEHKPEPLRDDVQFAIKRAREQGHTLVGFAGPMGASHALGPLIDAARQLEHERFAFVLLGDGLHREHLVQQAQQAGLDHRMSILPAIPRTQMASFLQAIDIAYLGWRKSPVHRFGIASDTLMDYLMARCVVLHSVEAGNDPVREAECGLSVEAENPTAIARGLRQLAMITDPFERAVMGQRGHEYAKAHHSYPVLAARFMDAIQQVRVLR